MLKEKPANMGSLPPTSNAAVAPALPRMESFAILFWSSGIGKGTYSLNSLLHWKCLKKYYKSATGKMFEESWRIKARRLLYKQLGGVSVPKIHVILFWKINAQMN